MKPRGWSPPRVGADAPGGKHKLPSPLDPGVDELAIERIRQHDAAHARHEITLVLFALIQLQHPDLRPEVLGLMASLVVGCGGLGYMVDRMRVVAAEPVSRFVVQTRDKSGTFEFAFLLSPEAGGTRLTYRMTPLRGNPVLNLLVNVFFWPLVGKPSFLQTLANLKAKTEAAARAG